MPYQLDDYEKMRMGVIVNKGPQRHPTQFEKFAMDHAAHNHCQGCGGCLLEQTHIVQGYPSWCIGCRDRIKATLPKGARLPWTGLVDFSELQS